MAERAPLLYLGPLTQRVYLTMRYRELPGGTIEVTGRKWDVTDQVGKVLADLDAAGLELRPSAGSGEERDE